MLIRKNVPLAPMTTFKVGGPTRYFTEARTLEDVTQAVKHARKQGWPLFVLGGGSNLVISDAGWPGLVLRIGITDIERRPGSEAFEVGAGEEWDKFVAYAVSQNCAGIECLSGIPGSTGGTPVQNVGAYGQEVAETIESVQVLDTRDEEIREFCNEACGFSYRTSIFNSTERGRYIVLRVDFALRAAGEPGIEYADLKRYFAAREKPPTLAETREAVRQIRARKGMLIVPGDEDCCSAGSFFKNPVLPDTEYKSLHERAQARGLQIPSYPALDAHRKVSAAWLVENSGFAKGYRRGPVGISRKHALAIVNRGGAKAADIIALKDEIQQQVGEMWDVQLQPEPVLIGFDNSPT
ncbi:MAG TPA: UDP-N-acetylmuramate dehydrogenase [Terriglobales bacterium]|nr:UDP-N-acetylmuramate dehydrogenase [Terriglobales bacterium]